MTRNKLAVGAFAVFAVLMAGFAVAGGVRSYCPVPQMDMWEQTLQFFLRLSQGDNAAWWEQYNEHRIVLSRLLFWVDYTCFGGTSRFLIICNYLLMGLSVLVFWRILRGTAKTEKRSAKEILLGLFLTGWLFLWSQVQNLVWGFQSQFILAQLLPLCALYLLQDSMAGAHARRRFIAACVLGFVSIGAMANGILALPLMTCYALATRQARARIGVLGVLSAAALILFFHGYQLPICHPSFLDALKNNRTGLLHYIGLYIGGPFYYMLGQGTAGKALALLAAAIFVALSARLAVKLLRGPRRDTLGLALLFFIAYIGGTALGTAGHRLVFGPEQALLSRYTTPAVMAWAALLILHAPGLLAPGQDKISVKFLVLLSVLALAMIPQQLLALKSQARILFEQKIAALALELGVHDRAQIGKIVTTVRSAENASEKASAKNLSVFGTYPFQDAREQLGQTAFPQPDLPACQGGLKYSAPVYGDARFLTVMGWMFDPKDKAPPRFIRLISGQGKVVGFALTGLPLQELAGAIDKKALQAGFRGYLLAGQEGTQITLEGEKPSCRMQAYVPMPVFSHYLRQDPSPDLSTVESTDVLPGGSWTGADFAGSVYPGMRVYGSYIHSDADKGSISLSIKPGARIFYHSGQTGGRQFFELPGSGTRLCLPVATDWVLLDFSREDLQPFDSIIKFVDKGDTFGEWSAIAVRQGDVSKQQAGEELVSRDGRFTRYGNGIVYDAHTALEWVAGPDTDTNWDVGRSWVEGLALSGGGWRMPSRKELKSLYQKGEPRNMTPLIKTSGWFVWSGEAKGPSEIWGFCFCYGAETWIFPSGSDKRAFAVRSRK